MTTPYITVDELKLYLSDSTLASLSNDYNPTVINETLVNAVILGASGYVDAYLRQAYAVPFTTIPDNIKAITAQITIYRLYSRRTDVPDSIKQGYDDAISILKIMGRERYVEESPEMEGQNPITGASFDIPSGDDGYFTELQIFTP